MAERSRKPSTAEESGSGNRELFHSGCVSLVRRASSWAIKTKTHTHTLTEAKSVKAAPFQFRHVTEIMLHLQHRSFFYTHFDCGYCYSLVQRVSTFFTVAG